MTPYKSRSGKQSGVTGYKIGTDYIIVQFTNRTVYKYSYKSCGQETTETMKELARTSLGLSTFISQHDPVYEK